MNDEVMDLLSILSIILQLEVMEEQKNQSDNNDIMEELQRQDKAYLNKIIHNQKIIIEKLNNLTERLT
jgi:hypothetical protein